MAFIPQEVIDEIASRVNIVDIISQYVPLKKQGHNYMGLCPFHNEKTPSFSVSEERQFFHCFGCGAGGNVFNFIMKTEHVNFPEACHILARQVGVDIPEEDLSPQEKKAQAWRKRLYEVNELACTYYEKVLGVREGEAYLAYLKNRGLSADTIKNFRLGGCLPNRWNGLVIYLQREGASLHDAETLGLIQKRRDGKGYIDRFRDRLMFPITDENGKIIAFGGRIIEKDKAPQKYINSSETPIFHKGSMLYGLHHAKRAIRAADRAILVEGYMDVLAMHQNGFANTVAPLGTSLTEGQVKRLMRHTYRYTTAFDGDGAGQNATIRALNIMENLGARANVIVFAAKEDPDDVLRKDGKEALQKKLDQAASAIDFRLKVALNGRRLHDFDDKMVVLGEVLPHVLKLSKVAEQETAIETISQTLDLSQAAIRDEMRLILKGEERKNRRFQAEEPEKKSPKPTVTAAFIDEARLFLIIMQNRKFFAKVKDLGGASLFATSVKRLYLNISEDLFLESFDAGQLDVELAEIYALVCSVGDYDKKQETEVFYRTLENVERRALATLEQEATQRLKQAEKERDEKAVFDIISELDELRQRRKALEAAQGREN